VAMGGRVAEELIFGYDKVTTGASSDINTATAIARRMVTEWGMSDKLGPLKYAEDSEEVFLGHSVSRQKNMSDATAEIVDSEIRRIVDAAHERARTILKDYRNQLDDVAHALLEHETLSGDDINKLIAGEKIDPAADAEAEKPKRKSSPVSAARRKKTDEDAPSAE